MDAQRVRSGEIKSCRCKSQVLQGYYNSVATVAGLFAGRFPTLNPVNTAAGAAGNLRGGAYAPDWRNFRIPLRGRNRSPAQAAGRASFCGTNISPLKRAEEGAQNPLPRVLCPRFSLCAFDAHAAHNRITQIPPWWNSPRIRSTPPLRRRRPRRAEKIKLQPHLKALASILRGLLVFQSVCGCAPVFIPCLNRNQTSGAQSVFGTFRGETRLNITRPQPAIFKWF